MAVAMVLSEPSETARRAQSTRMACGSDDVAVNSRAMASMDGGYVALVFTNVNLVVFAR